MSNQWYDVDTLQWVDTPTYEWGFSLDVNQLNQIFTDNNFVYAATVSGLDIVSIETELSYSFTPYLDGYSTVWASDDNVYLGTASGGIKRLTKEHISSGDLSSYIEDYVSVPDLTSNNVRYIHGNDTKLICCTNYGVDIIRRDNSYITHTYGINVTKCFVTPKHDYYYYISYDGDESSINRLNQNISDWTDPEVVYTIGHTFLSDITDINDICVTEHTSLVGDNNTIFLATDLGALIYDEGSLNRLLIANKL